MLLLPFLALLSAGAPLGEPDTESPLLVLAPEAQQGPWAQAMAHSGVSLSIAERCTPGRGCVQVGWDEGWVVQADGAAPMRLAPTATPADCAALLIELTSRLRPMRGWEPLRVAEVGGESDAGDEDDGGEDHTAPATSDSDPPVADETDPELAGLGDVLTADQQGSAPIGQVGDGNEKNNTPSADEVAIFPIPALTAAAGEAGSNAVGIVPAGDNTPVFWLRAGILAGRQRETTGAFGGTVGLAVEAAERWQVEGWLVGSATSELVQLGGQRGFSSRGGGLGLSWQPWPRVPPRLGLRLDLERRIYTQGVERLTWPADEVSWFVGLIPRAGLELRLPMGDSAWALDPWLAMQVDLKTTELRVDGVEAGDLSPLAFSGGVAVAGRMSAERH